MVDTMTVNSISVTQLERRNTRVWVAAFVALLLCSILIGVSSMGAPSPATIGWLIYAIGIAALFYEPRYGVYLLIFLSLLGDSLVAPWYPFNKNLSSAESLFFVNSAMKFSPLEIYLVLTVISWLIHGLMQRRLQFFGGRLLKPMLAYAALLIFGMVYGFGRHGDINTGLWEVRPIFYLITMWLLATNLLRKREHVITAFWFVLIALWLEGLLGIYKVTVTLGGDLHGVEAIGEHSMSIHEDAFLAMLFVGVLYKIPPKRWLILLAMAPPILFSYASNQRRASYISLALALMLMAVVMYKVNRRAFWRIVPVAAALGLIYTAAFWNSTSSIGGPARAIRSVIAPVKNGRDDRSNEYRVIENVNTDYNIHHAPLTGLGFGQKFIIVAPLPDISFFAWWEYITHNSIMWIWMKLGFFGYFAMIFLVGITVMDGSRLVWRMPVRGELSAITLIAVLYVIMHFVYAYVDMSWDNQSMLFVGLMAGILNRMELIMSVPRPLPRKRWPWQPDPKPEPGLEPIG